jgi:hypothetical protein
MAQRRRSIPARPLRSAVVADTRNDSQASRRRPESRSTVVAGVAALSGASRHAPLHQLGGSLAGNDATPQSSTSSRSRVAGSAASVTSACRSAVPAVLCFGSTALWARTDQILDIPGTIASGAVRCHWARSPLRFESEAHAWRGDRAPAPAVRPLPSLAILLAAGWEGVRRRRSARGGAPGVWLAGSAMLAVLRLARGSSPLRTGARSSRPRLTHPHRGLARRRRQRCCAAGRARRT